MTTTTKRLIMLLGGAMLWAGCVQQEPDKSGSVTSASYMSYMPEDEPPPPPPPPPEPETCTADGEPDKKQLEDAKRRLEGYLKGCRGQDAIDKVMDEFDKNNDKNLTRDELLGLIRKIGLGAPFYKTACGKVMTFIDKNNDGYLNNKEMTEFLDTIGLGGTPGQCDSEDGP